MGARLTVSAKGRITLLRAVLAHLGVKPGERVDITLLSDGRVELRPVAGSSDLSSLRGILRRPEGGRVVSLAEMQRRHRHRFRGSRSRPRAGGRGGGSGLS